MEVMEPEARGEAGGRNRLVGRRILVVGAGSTPVSDDAGPPIGNGRAIASLAAREGASVACVDKRGDEAAETVRQIEAKGGSAFAIEANVSHEAECESLVAAAAENLDGLDGLVLNVGFGMGRGLVGTAVGQWDKVFAVNIRSHFLIARAVLPIFPEGSSIVFISSIAAIKPGTRSPAYDSSKAGLFALCRHVALEGAERRIRANVVVLGRMDTPAGRAGSKVRPQRDRTPIPLGRQGTAWESAYATTFLLSDEASYITGQSLVVDGGLSSLYDG